MSGQSEQWYQRQPDSWRGGWMHRLMVPGLRVFLISWARPFLLWCFWFELCPLELISIQFIWLPNSNSMSTKPHSWLSLGSSSLSSGNSGLIAGVSAPVTVTIHSTHRGVLWLQFLFPCILTPGIECVGGPRAKLPISRKFCLSNFCLSPAVINPVQAICQPSPRQQYSLLTGIPA